MRFLGLAEAPVNLTLEKIMSIFDLFKNKSGRFISEKKHKKNLASQMEMSPLTLDQLRDYNVTEDTMLKLEFFFYTDSNEKAQLLAEDLKSIVYSVEFGDSAEDENMKIITGWSSPLKMSSQPVLDWTEEMCCLGFKHDCEFDGWGTNPEQ